MRLSIHVRCVCIACVLVLAVILLRVYPIQLGLDLQGGVHLVLAVDIEEGMRREAAIAMERGKPFERTPAADAARRSEWVDQARRTIERRVNSLGVSEPRIAVQGPRRDRLLVELPGMTDIERAKAIIQSTGLLELTLVEAGPEATAAELPQLPGAQLRVLPAGGVDTTGHYLLRAVPAVTGTDIRAARPSLDELNHPSVTFTLSGDAAQRFSAFTAEHIGRELAIVLDGRVHSAPTIENRIGAEGTIRGSFTPQEAQDLAVILQSGALGAALRYVEQQTIGATLGADAIRAGIIASIAAALLVAAFMVVYYGSWGANAVIAMILNVTILLALTALLGGVLTLPGIAGLVLTMGIGVDSNVLIFERMNEELAAERPFAASMRAAFRRVFLTLLDTHVAALVAAALLFQFGTSTIRGFAVTLSIGLLANLFTSTFVSRTLFELAPLRGRT